MNMLQKTLLSVVTILTFGSYSYYARSQDMQLTAGTVAAGSTNVAQQQTADSSASPPPDFQAYVDRINAEAAKTQPAAQKPQVVRYDDEGEGEDDEGGRRVAVRQAPPVKQQPAVTVQPKPKPQPAPVVPAAAPAVASGQYKDGSYTGTSVNVYYGYVQVKAIVQGGAIADVKFLQYPSDRNTSVQINTYAMPILAQEAIQAQSAQVDGVSGASATSQGFVESLGNALAQAKV